MPDSTTLQDPSKNRARGEKLLEDLQAMVPDLRARGQAAEDAGRIPEETIEDLKRIKAFHAAVPESYGGMEVPFPIIPQIFRMLGRGCTSTAWCMGFLIYHSYQFAHYSRKSQDESFGTRGYTMAAGQVVPGGEAVRVEGGYRISGRWAYGTGILHCDWMAVPAPVRAEDGSVEVYRFYLPAEEFGVLDTWNVAAMRATGSRDVTLDDVFIPEHRALSVESLRDHTGPGLEINKGPLYRVPVLTYMAFGTVGPLIGAAEAMIEIVSDILKTKVGAYSGDSQQGLMTQKVRLARLDMELQSVIGLFENKMNFVWERLCRGETVSREERAEMRMVVSHIARKSREIVDELAQAAGSRGNYLDSPIQRFSRDANALATHAIFEYDHVANLYGGTILDVDLPNGAMI